jgi:soluble lytic murein transglycosylase-like protein
MSKFILMIIGVLSMPFKALGVDVEYIQKAATSYQVSPSLMLAFAEIESNFNPNAIRFEPKFKTYSVGLFQIFYPTARSMGFKGNIKKLMSPEINTKFAAKHIKECTIRFSSLPAIACCYNAGTAVKSSVCRNNLKVRAYVNKVMSSQKKWERKLKTSK